MKQTTITKNKRAYFDYELQDEFIAGIELFGHEVKSIRAHNVSLKGSFVTIKDNEAWLTNAHIKQYPFANLTEQYEAERPRKLLLHKKELTQLIRAREQKLTIVPLTIFTSGRLIKIKIAIARGKKLHDKRSKIRERELSIEAERDMKKAPKKLS